MAITHRSVVPAPAWALEVLRQRALTRLATGPTPSLPGLEIRACHFETWLAAGGERREHTRRPLEPARDA